jgi:CubicO group peptidase (beta-lactamase class C family)
MQSKYFLFAAVILLPLGGAAQSQAPADLDQVVGAAMAQSHTPGFALGVVKDGQVVLARGYGERSAGSNAPVDERTVFSIGSLTKAFTAAGVGLLVDEGKLGWDDPVQRYLPDFRMYDGYVTSHLTLRDTLSHRSGLEETEYLVLGTDISREEMLRRLRHVPPTYGFRAKAAYQNAMLLVPGQVSARVAGSDWDRLIAERLFKPLGMQDSRTSVRATEGMPSVAAPHVVLQGAAQQIAPLHIENVAPSGGINASLRDMLVWARFQLALGRHEGRQLLQEKTVLEMWQPSMARNANQLRWPDSHLVAYGMGWVVSDYHGYRIVHHDGAIDGMTAKVLLVPELKLGFVALSNLNYSSVPNVAVYALLDTYLGLPRRDWLPHFSNTIAAVTQDFDANQAGVEKLREPGAKLALAPAVVTGTYHHAVLGDAVVTNAGGVLRLQLLGKRAPLEVLRADTFKLQFDPQSHTYPAYTVKLGKSVKGRPASITIDIYGEVFVMPRRP